MATTPNYHDIMKEAQRMQKRMQETQEELTKQEVTASAGNGLVKILYTCRHDALDVKLQPSLFVDADIEMIQDLIKAAINDGRRRIESVSRDKVSKLTAGMTLPTDLLPDDDQEG